MDTTRSIIDTGDRVRCAAEGNAEDDAGGADSGPEGRGQGGAGEDAEADMGLLGHTGETHVSRTSEPHV
ncbi:hypothetical protein [Streptomyces rubradiris]|uniref:Uncharacterized protein n=1 Tax=Streptomyces rubradiris TaxID=285531 RepID=A0ABQ3R350_STRRR|nr:hypothetical protein [Streptomyces rubradiris]GHH01424.1 hypothetical protein GCM10018792_16760 [Streptomyces rubradiris]GHI50285.1 hypothetical protein Srubr_01310 [Streptomyces rubradiris]